MILMQHKIIFLHIQKTAGTPVNKTLKFKSGDRIDEPCGMHYTLTNLLKLAPYVNLDEYEVLTIKRNVWERFASFYVDSVYDYDMGRIWNAPKPWKRYFKGLSDLEDMADKMLVDGLPPKNLTMLNFNNIEAEFIPWWNERFDYHLDSLPRWNEKLDQKYVDLKREIVMDPQYQECISKLCKSEIDYFGWKVPDYAIGTQ